MSDETNGRDDAATKLGLGAATRKGIRRIHWVSLLLLLVIGTVAYPLLFSGQSSSEISYKIAASERGTLVIKVNATGTVNQVDVGSELSGTIRTLNVDFNDKVATGQILAQLDTEQL